MKFKNISEFPHGYLIRASEPALVLNSNLKVAHQFFPKAFRGVSSTVEHTQSNYILAGSCIVSGQVCNPGDIYVYEVGETTDVLFLEDTHLIIITELNKD